MPVQLVTSEQARFEVAVGAVLSKTPSETLQVVSAAHARSVVPVGAAVWYSVEEHDPIAAHCRSELTVGATVWYSLVVHTR